MMINYKTSLSFVKFLTSQSFLAFPRPSADSFYCWLQTAAVKTSKQERFIKFKHPFVLRLKDGDAAATKRIHLKHDNTAFTQSSLKRRKTCSGNNRGHFGAQLTLETVGGGQHGIPGPAGRGGGQRHANKAVAPP